MGRIYSKRGCMVCKRRRKKCDEEKPACKACSRLGLPCLYPGTAAPRQPFSTPSTKATASRAYGSSVTRITSATPELVHDGAALARVPEVVTVLESHGLTAATTSHANRMPMFSQFAAVISPCAPSISSERLLSETFTTTSRQLLITQPPLEPASYGRAPLLGHLYAPIGREYIAGVQGEWMSWSSQSQQLPTHAIFEDCIVRAIVEGWDAVGAKGHQHLTLKVLRGIDENTLSACPPVERMAMLRHMSQLLAVRFEPLTERIKNVPFVHNNWVAKHHLRSCAAVYTAWPGLRSAFRKTEKTYKYSFWQLLVQAVHLDWPRASHDCYTYDCHNDMYRITSAFDERIRNARSWTIRADFVEKYPELADIAAPRGKRSVIERPLTSHPATHRDITGNLNSMVYSENEGDDVRRRSGDQAKRGSHAGHGENELHAGE